MISSGPSPRQAARFTLNIVEFVEIEVCGVEVNDLLRIGINPILKWVRATKPPDFPGQGRRANCSRLITCLISDRV